MLERERHMQKLWIYALVLTVTALVVPPVAAKVTVDFNKTVDFSTYKTYAWRPGTPAKDPLMQKRIQKAVEAELAAKGLTKTEGPADLYVVTQASSKNEKQIDVNSLGYAGYRWHGWGAWGPTTVNMYEIPVGTLIVDLLVGKSNELVWRGVATETLSDNPQKIAKRINKVVAKMFKKFPPKE
jgi:hypothetical protein